MQRLDDKSSKLDFLINTKINNLTEKINFSNQMLESYSFKNVLKRGYSIVWNGNTPISNKEDLEKISSATIEFANGKIDIFTTPQQNISNIKKIETKSKKKKEIQPSTQGDLF